MCLENTRSGSTLLHLGISSNPFNCDCKDFEIISFVRLMAHTHRLDGTNCKAPPDLYDWQVCSFSFMQLGSVGDDLNQMICSLWWFD